ncbi:50S ribosomal protein L35 [Candidatus Parcubacteria bacterium]|nr:MAG: 50S ribosomal protein L35 [Candidatus Parcubacteria bacterium]
MPKMKTYKGAAKRFKFSANGKLRRIKQGKGHLKRRTPKRSRRLFDKLLTDENNTHKRQIQRLAPYLRKK